MSNRVRERYGIYNEFGRLFFEQLVELKGAKGISPSDCARQLGEGLGQPCARPVWEMLWWLIRLGIVVPSAQHFEIKMTMFSLTSHGRHVVTNLDKFPLGHGYLDGLKRRCPGLTEEVLVLFDDASTCLQHGLSRPAIVLIGLAFETVVKAVGEVLVGKGELQASFSGALAWKRIDLLNEYVQKSIPKTEQGPFKRALDFAHLLRDRRNDASHTLPRFPFDDADEIQAFIIGATLHLPLLWQLK